MGVSLFARFASPEYRDRHLFTARLRLAIFIGFWILYLYFFWGVLVQMRLITGIVGSSFFLTAVAYFSIIRDRMVFFSILLEIFADLLSITAILHIAGGPYSDFFTVYLFYIFAAGIFYDYLHALFVALACGLVYGGYLLLCQAGVIVPLVLEWGEQIPIDTHSPIYHFFFWAVFALLVVYAVKVSSFFNQKRERQLEGRNKELSALARMSSTIRTTISLDKVLEEILDGLQSGLDMELYLLVLFDWEKKNARLLAPKGHPLVAKVRALVGEKKLGEFTFPLQNEANPALQAILKSQIFYRKNLEELVIGLEPPIDKNLMSQIQQAIGFKRLVGMPLVAERELMGALLGFTGSTYIDEQSVKTLEAFANQAALILEAALLIQKLRKANQDLKEANRVKSEFLATMSHELRTPLTAIIGFSELLLEGVMGPLQQEQEESLREVLNNGATLLDLINNLLDMAKVEAGKMTLEIRPFDCNELLTRIVHTIGSLIQKKNQTLHLELAKEAPPLHADEKKIQQIVLNLLSNAIKFTPEGGKISVTLFFHPRHKRGGEFELTVADTGAGIKPENLDKVFEMFSQGDSTVTRIHGGTGLGLTLAKQLTELHHGKILVESRVGKGTKFTVTLPTK